jgi:hypothetical protein
MSKSKNFLHSIEDREYETQIKHDEKTGGYLIHVLFNNQIIGGYVFSQDMTSYEFFEENRDVLMDYLNKFTFGFIEGWDKYRRTKYSSKLKK